MRYFAEPLQIMDQINPQAQIMLTLGTDDDKGVDEAYTPKYVLYTASQGITLPFRIGCMANAPHTTQTPLQAAYWEMWNAHIFLQRLVPTITSINHENTTTGTIAVNCTISGPPLQEVHLWSTNQTDLDTSHWDGFISANMTLEDDVYQGEIPADTVAYFIEAVDEEGGIVSSVPPAGKHRILPGDDRSNHAGKMKIFACKCLAVHQD